MTNKISGIKIRMERGSATVDASALVTLEDKTTWTTGTMTVNRFQPNADIWDNNNNMNEEAFHDMEANLLDIIADEFSIEDYNELWEMITVRETVE